MITSYKDMRLHHLLDLAALDKTTAPDAVKELMTIAVLCDETPDAIKALPATEYGKRKAAAAFLLEPVPEYRGVVRTVTINDTIYTVCHRMDQVTTGQYIDWCTYMGGDKNVIDLYSCFVIPKGHKYGDGYDLDKAKEDIAELPISVAAFISNFWKTSLHIFLRRSAREMEKEARKLRRIVVTEEQRQAVKMLEDKIAEVRSLLASGGTASRPSTSTSA